AESDAVAGRAMNAPVPMFAESASLRRDSATLRGTPTPAAEERAARRIAPARLAPELQALVEGGPGPGGRVRAGERRWGAEGRGEGMRRVVAAVVVGWLTVLPAAAEPVAREQVPEALRPWTDWVMHGHEEAFCSLLQGSTDHRQCAWPSRLTLDLDGRAGRFTQDWLVQRAGWVPLPGDAARAPLDVRADGKPAAVTFRSGVPSVRLERGAHTVSGVFEWDSLPELLPIPAETGLVS